jgi:CRP-like cAMP-binding protein
LRFSNIVIYVRPACSNQCASRCIATKQGSANIRKNREAVSEGESTRAFAENAQLGAFARGGQTGNLLLDALDDAGLERVREHSTRVDVKALEILVERGQPVAHVYFPQTAVVSVVRPIRDGTYIETGTIGREGFTGMPVMLGVPSDARMEVQVPGHCLRMEAAVFRDQLAEVPAFRVAAGKFVSALFDQVGQSVICSLRHSIPQRCARWLLMARDRVDGDEFYLTHTTLARMLDVRRAGVTRAALVLKRAGLLDYHRGHVTIVDRAGLESAACECYDVNRRHMEALQADLGRDRQLS